MAEGVCEYPVQVDLAAVAGGVDCDIEQARGIANGAYTQPGFLAYERDQVFAPTWACIGVGHDVVMPGDVKPIDFMGLPLILLRDADGGVHVFHNVCSHRGVRLVEQPMRVKRTLVCPYHAWTYDLDGRLRGTPHIGGQDKHQCPGFDPCAHGLREVRSAVWFDMVMINLSGDAPPLSDHVGALTARWSHIDPSAFRHGGLQSSWELDLACNWKLAVENHNDAYHLPWVHKSLNSYSRFEDHYDIVGDDHYAGQGSLAYRAPRPQGEPALPRIENLPPQWHERAEYIALFPNAIVGVHADHYWSVWLEPRACDRTLERMNLYFVGDASCTDDYANVREAVKGEWLRIWAEDQEVVERMQRGRHSPAFVGGVFSPALDAATHQFHRWFARRLLNTT